MGGMTFERAKQLWQYDRDNESDWRREALIDFDFASGRQWTDEQQADLKDKGKIPMCFNFLDAMVKALGGYEENMRMTISFKAVGNEDASAAELINAANSYIEEECDAYSEHNDAFQETGICGRGWIEADLDENDDGAPMYVERRIDPLEIWVDRDSTRRGYADSRRFWRIRQVDTSVAMELYDKLGAKGLTEQDIDAGWAYGDADDNMSMREKSGTRTTIVEMQYQCPDEMLTLANGMIDPMTGESAPIRDELGRTVQTIEVLKSDYERSEKEFAGFAVVGSKKINSWRKVLLGSNEILYDEPTFLEGKMPTYFAITGDRDRNMRQFKGIIRLLRDPQMFANKFLSDTSHIVTNTASGGILAEENAFSDAKQAQATYNRADKVTFTSPGAISNGKIMAKPISGIPAGHVEMMRYAKGSISDVSGINLELLGMQTREQPGILEQQRKQAALTIVATLFSSLRSMRKRLGKARLIAMKRYLADGRMIRIAGTEDGEEKAAELTLEALKGRFDTRIDATSNSPFAREQAWAAIQQLLAMFKDQVPQEALLEAVRYSPIPTAMISKLEAMFAAAKEEQPDPEQEMQKAMIQRGAEADIAGKEAKTRKDMADAQQTETETEMMLMPQQEFPPMSIDPMTGAVTNV